MDTSTCLICGKKFISLPALVLHLETYPSSKINRFKCIFGDCFKIFSNSHSFRRHLQIHVKKGDCKRLFMPQQVQEFPSTSKSCQLELDFDVLEEEETILEDNVDVDIQEFIFKNVTKLYAKSSLPLSQAEIITSQLKEVSELIISSLTRKINSSTTLEAAKDVMNNASIDFKPFGNSKALKTSLEVKNVFFEPSKFVVFNETIQTFSLESVNFKNISHHGIIMPIKSQLKAFLELPNVFKTIMSQENKLEAEYSQNIYSHLIHGRKWRKIRAENPDKIIIPITLYNDDFQVDDCVGPHSGRNSISAFYFQIGTLPQYLLSRLSYIFVALLAYTKDLKEESVDPALYALVDIFNDLEVNGLTITTENGSEFKVYFVLCHFVGDNLGLHTVCGFSKGFNCNKCCRFCLIPLVAMKTACRLNEKFPERTIEHYNHLFESQIYLDFGIERNSIMNKLPNFHVLTNKTADVMHDLFIGVFKYGLKTIFQKYVKVFKYSLDLLNRRINEHAKIENFKLSDIKENQLGKDGNLHMNAREVWFVVEHLTLILPSAASDNEKEVFKFAVLMNKVLQACLLTSFSEFDLQSLSRLTTEHHQAYLKLSGDTLKPKFHFMLHYPDIIRTSGPLRFMMCMRFEAKHQEIKGYTHVSFNRKNVCYSIGKKFAFKFADFLLNHKDITNPSIENFKRWNQYPPEPLLASIRAAYDDIEPGKKVTFKGTDYSIGNYIPLELGAIVILNFLKTKNDKIIIVYKMVTTSYNKSLNWFELASVGDKLIYQDLSEFSYFPVIAHPSNQKLYIQIKKI